MSSPPTARWDLAQLLDIEVDQITGMVVLVAADHPTGRPVHPRQPVEPVPDQNPMHR
jgi:hypothetical protein